MAHRLKVVAEHRGIPYETHRDVYALKDRLLEDYPEPKELQSLFVTADSLHKNYYADTQPIEELRRRLDRIAELLDILERPEFSGPGVRGHRDGAGRGVASRRRRPTRRGRGVQSVR